MTIEHSSDGPVVVGREVKNGSNASKAQAEDSLKREREKETETSSKRVRTDSEPTAPSNDEPVTLQTRVDASVASPRPHPVATGSKSKGDVFLAHGVREQLQTELDVSPSLVSFSRS